VQQQAPVHRQGSNAEAICSSRGQCAVQAATQSCTADTGVWVQIGLEGQQQCHVA
jgi:hypothetical protein